MYTVGTDLTNGIVEVVVIGLWDVAHVADVARDMHRAAQTIVRTGQTHLLLVDYSRSSVQPQNVVVALQQYSLGATFRAERCAMFTEGNLARLQAKRIAMTHESIAVFADRASAVAWLLETRTGQSKPTL